MKHIMVIYPCTLDRKGFKCKLSPSYKSCRLFCRYVIALFYFVFLLLFITKIKHLLTSVCDNLRNVYYTKCVLFSICRSLRGTYKVKCELRWTIWSDYNREGRTNRKSRYVVTDSSYRVVRMKYLDQNCIPVVCMIAFFYFRMDILRTTSMMYHKKEEQRCRTQTIQT